VTATDNQPDTTTPAPVGVPATRAEPNAMTRRLLVFIPLAIFLGLAALFYLRLGAGDISRIPSVLIGREAPVTVLPGIAGLDRDGKAVPGIDAESFKGQVSVLNVWASWRIPCRTEAPLLMRLATDKRVRIVGINQRDANADARRFLARYGNPFSAIGVDANNRASIEWGVYGVPETFLVGRDGRVIYKLIGEVTPENLETVLKVEINKALAANL
jgi:cytochrome c biogenesis protein CcmG/thiol:disulfide interchange protein DsbE